VRWVGGGGGDSSSRSSTSATEKNKVWLFLTLGACCAQNGSHFSYVTTVTALQKISHWLQGTLGCPLVMQGAREMHIFLSIPLSGKHPVWDFLKRVLSKQQAQARWAEWPPSELCRSVVVGQLSFQCCPRLPPTSVTKSASTASEPLLLRRDLSYQRQFATDLYWAQHRRKAFNPQGSRGAEWPPPFLYTHTPYHRLKIEPCLFVLSTYKAP